MSATVRIVDLIEHKRDGGSHSAAELAALVDGFVRGDVPEYQIAAWLTTLTEVGVTHHVRQVADSEQWPNYTDALELVAREVIPRVRSRQ